MGKKKELLLRRSFFVLAPLAFFISFVALYTTVPRLYSIKITRPDGVSFPARDTYYLQPSNLPNLGAGQYTIEGLFYKESFNQTKVRIVPDICLLEFYVNDKLVDISGQNTCLSDDGFEVELKPYLRTGENTVLMKIENDGQRYGAYFTYSFNDPLFRTLLTLMLLFLFLTILTYARDFISRPTKGDMLLLVVISLSLILRIFYTSYTRFDVRTHDVEGHLDYIKYFAQNLSFPDADHCYECHQKPLYYVFSAVEARLLELSGFSYTETTRALQITNALFFTLFIIVGVLILKKFKLNKYLLLTVTTLFAFWPSGIIHSVRISNDSLYYFLYSLSFYSIFLYYLHRKSKTLWYSILFFFLAIQTKITAISLFFVIGMILVTLFMQHKVRFGIKRMILLICLLGLTLFFSFIPFFFQANSRPLASRITKSDQISDDLYVGNKLNNYLSFDVRMFVKYPFASTWDDALGRQSFWHQVLKTSLFGEFHIGKNGIIYLALIESVLFLPLMFAIVVGVILSLRSSYSTPFLLNALFLLMVFLIYRIRFPAANNTDFRYIYPILLSVIYFISIFLKKIQYRKLLYLIFMAMTLIFSAISFIIFLSYPYLNA